MLAYPLKKILELVPEAQEHVKQASLEQDLPLDNKDSCVASALALKYFEKIAYKSVDIDQIEKIATAVKLYQVEDLVNSMADRMVKAAAAVEREKKENSPEVFMSKQASFEYGLCGMIDLVEESNKAVELYKEAKDRGIEPNEEVVRYSGNGYFLKEAAIKALAVRYSYTQNPDFVKIASALYRNPAQEFKPETVRDICATVSEMDKQAKLNLRGMNFFKETIFTKEAALASAITIKLDKKEIPYETIQRVGSSRIADYLGKDIAAEMDKGPMNAKQVFESLPRDSQRMICNLCANV